jgi:hypothetical protein
MVVYKKQGKEESGDSAQYTSVLLLAWIVQRGILKDWKLQSKVSP